MPINPSIGMVAAAVQTARDTPASTPTFMHGLTGGTPFAANRSIANTPVACGSRSASDVRVDSVSIEPSVETLCYPDVIGLYLYAVLGEVSSQPEGGNYKHVFTMGQTLPYLTIWSQVGTNNFTMASGCKCSQLQISATGNEHLQASASFVGINAKIGIDAIPGDLTASCYGGKYTTTDCTFKLDTASETPEDAIVADCTFTISNNVEGSTSMGRVIPRDVSDGQITPSVTVTTIPDDITQYKKMITGSASSTDVTGKVVMGSVYAKFVSTDNPDWYIEFKMNHVAFTADYPSVDPEGTQGTIQFTCDRAISKNAGESPITVTVVNGTESYKLD